MGEDSDESTGDVAEVEFRTFDGDVPFVRASRRADCWIDLAEIVPRPDDRFGEFFEVYGASPSTLATVGESVDGVDATVHRSHETGGLVELVVGPLRPAVRLAQLDALPRVVRGADGRGRIVAEVPADRAEGAVVETFLDEFPTFDLIAKRTKEAIEPPFSQASFRRLADEHLTDRQREVLLTAYEAGYYDWPRECTGNDVAARLGISSATFSQHVHAAERKLLSILFDRHLAGESFDRVATTATDDDPDFDG